MISANNNVGYFPQMPICDKILSTELNFDLSLPDYQPEIRRLLSTRAHLMPRDEYLGNDKAELAGEICFHILYIGADGAIYCAKFIENYALSCPLEFNAKSVDTNDLTLLHTTICESASTRVLGPRKLNIRSKLMTNTLAVSPALYTPSISERRQESTIENLIFSAPCATFKKGTGEPLLLEERIILDSQIENARIIDSNFNVMVTECSPQGDKISCRGEVLLKILYCNDTESMQPLLISRKIPFSYHVDCEGIDGSYEFSAMGFTHDEMLEIEENDIKCEFYLTLHATGLKNGAISYVNDCYSTECQSSCTRQEVEILGALRCLNGNLTQNESIRLEEIKLSPNAKIIDTLGKAKVNELTCENGKLLIKGECNYQILYYIDEEFASTEFTLPFKYELDAKNAPNCENLRHNVCAEVLSIRARCDNERLFVDSELSFSILVNNKSKIEVADNVTLGERFEKSNDELLICFPEKNETLWNIAKRYGEPESKLRAQNSIPTDEKIVTKKYLII